jgi:hypothetical protein
MNDVLANVTELHNEVVVVMLVYVKVEGYGSS